MQSLPHVLLAHLQPGAQPGVHVLLVLTHSLLNLQENASGICELLNQTATVPANKVSYRFAR